SEKAMKVFEVSVPSLHMFWLLPQYVLISVGEIMFSITGLEFSFTQAPASMKSVIQAAWLLTTAFGDLFVSMEFFLFAVLMALDMIVFYFLSKNFEENLKVRNRQSVVAEELSEGIEPSSQHSSQEDESVDQMDKNQTPKVDRHSALSDGEQMGSSL
ncbi:Peptide transporter family 1, partial [Armadillidium nasatum]